MNFFVQLLRNTKAQKGLLLLALFVVIAFVGPLLVADPSEFLGKPLRPPSGEFWLGTTQKGQDVFAQTVVGSRTTLLIGFFVGAAVMGIGALVGIAAGFFGGWVDDILSLITNVFLIMPGLPLAVVLAAYLEASPSSIALVLVITGWAWNARILRAQTLTIAKKDYINAATLSGESRLRIMFVEILPNMMSLLVSGFISAVVYAIGAQVGLEFLGLGDVSKVTWGTNLFWASNGQALLTESWWTILPTGFCVALLGFALSLVNFGVDEITNPRLLTNKIYKSRLASAGLRPGFATPVLTPKTKDSPSETDTRSQPTVDSSTKAATSTNNNNGASS